MPQLKLEISAGSMGHLARKEFRSLGRSSTKSQIFLISPSF